MPASTSPANETTPKAKTPPVAQQSAAASAFSRWRSGSNTSTSTTQTTNATNGEDNYTPAPKRSSAGRRIGLFGSVSSVGSAVSVSPAGRSPPRSSGSPTSYTPSLEESRGSLSGASTSSEGPNSPDPKPAAVLDRERVEIVQPDEVGRVGRLDAGVGLLEKEKKSGEVTPTGGGAAAAVGERVRLDSSVTVVA